MQKKTFKDYLREDIDQVFFKENEFAMLMQIDGKPITVIKDDEKLLDYNSNLSEGLTKGELLFYAPISQFGNRLFQGKQIIYKNKCYLIQDLSEDEGVYYVVLVGMQ